MRLRLSGQARVVNLEASGSEEVQVGGGLISHPDQYDVSVDEALRRDGRNLTVADYGACRRTDWSESALKLRAARRKLTVHEREERGEDGFRFGDLIVFDCDECKMVSSL